MVLGTRIVKEAGRAVRPGYQEQSARLGGGEVARWQAAVRPFAELMQGEGVCRLDGSGRLLGGLMLAVGVRWRAF